MYTCIGRVHLKYIDCSSNPYGIKHVIKNSFIIIALNIIIVSVFKENKYYQNAFNGMLLIDVIIFVLL